MPLAGLSGLRPGGKAQFTEAGHAVYDLFDQSSFTTTCVVRERNCVKVPKDFDLCKLGPLGCGYVTGSGSFERPQAPSWLKYCGLWDWGGWLALASDLGATETVNSKENDPAEAIKQITDGKGVDYVVDTTGLPSVIGSGIKSLASGGTCAAIAVSAHQVEVAPWNELCEGDRKLIGVMMGDSIPQIDIPRLIEFYRRGWFDFDKTERFYDFEDINEADAASVSG